MEINSISISDAIVHIRKGEARALKAGGEWIYDNEIQDIQGLYENGDILKVVDFDGYPLGYGFINDNSKIRVRMLSRYQEQAPNETLIASRVDDAWNYRMAVMNPPARIASGESNSFRLIFGEADYLPGLVVDLYNNVLVVESLALGIDRLKGIILSHLRETLSRAGIEIIAIYERSDAPVRRKEGMVPFKGLLWSVTDNTAEIEDYLLAVPVLENHIKYSVDVINGQKTGFFLDQKNNRADMQRLVSGALTNSLSNGNTTFRVLDCFTHMGTFALNCGYAINSVGATNIDSKVTGLDISEYAVSQASSNAKLNGLDSIVEFKAANVLDELPRLYDAGECYDVVILDPPAFTKSREATKNAIKGYREINMKGMKLVKNGGYLATCSCSHFMTQELFTQTIAQAAKSVHKRLRQIEFNTQSADHPILWSADESYYLKFYIFQVIDEK